jgi:hypothetical protein
VRSRHVPSAARPETLITALSGRSCRDESQLNSSSECGSRLAETGDGEGRIRGIENPIQGSPTGFHAGGELSLGDMFLFQDLLKLESHHTLDGEDFDFGTNSLICEEATVFSCPCLIPLSPRGDRRFNLGLAVTMSRAAARPMAGRGGFLTLGTIGTIPEVRNPPLPLPLSLLLRSLPRITTFPAGGSGNNRNS